MRGRERDEVQLGCNLVWTERGPRQGDGSEADGEEEMDEGGILIISHSQGGEQSREKSSHRCNGEFHYTSPPIESLKE